jgi:hypothetical protein
MLIIYRIFVYDDAPLFHSALFRSSPSLFAPLSFRSSPSAPHPLFLRLLSLPPSLSPSPLSLSLRLLSLSLAHLEAADDPRVLRHVRAENLRMEEAG